MKKKEEAPAAPFADRRTEKPDATGSVGITIALRSGGKHVTGNRTRYFTVPNARVSEVAAAIERALFGKAST